MRPQLRQRVGLAVVGGALVLGPGCDWREFDDVLAKAPVLSLGPPEGYASRDVGRVVLPLAVPAARAADVSARFLIGGTETPSLAVVDLDAAGRAHTTVASKVEIADMAGTANAAVKSAVALADGRVVLGTPSYSVNPMQLIRGRLYFLQLVDGPTGLAFNITSGADQVTRISYGLGLAVGKVVGPVEDIVVASQGDVVVLQGGNEAAAVTPLPTCALALDDSALEKYKFRALVTGAFIAGGGDEVAVGVPREDVTLPGHVVILSMGAAGLDCPVILESPAHLSRFGTSIVATDFNGDGALDLIVGAPPLRAYVYAGPFVPGKPALPLLELKHPTVTDAGVTGDFGFRVLAEDIDGVAGQEILVSAPDAPAGADTGAGEVFAFKRDGTLFGRIGDNSPEAEASFGFSLNRLGFSPKGCGTARPVLLVGSVKEVFTFFRVPGGPADPRCL